MPLEEIGAILLFLWLYFYWAICGSILWKQY